MTYIPEICTKNPYQKTGTINPQENRALSYLLPKTGARKVWYEIARQLHQKPVPVFCYQFSALISATCVIGIS